MMQVHETKGQKKSPNIGARMILMVGIGTLLSTIATITLWVFGQRVLAAVIGTATMFLFLFLGAIVLLAIGSWWSAALMERGGRLVLAAQISDDKRDGVLISQVGALTRGVLALVKGEQAKPASPPPVPVDWLPADVEHLSPQFQEDLS